MLDTQAHLLCRTSNVKAMPKNFGLGGGFEELVEEGSIFSGLVYSKWKPICVLHSLDCWQCSDNTTKRSADACIQTAGNLGEFSLLQIILCTAGQTKLRQACLSGRWPRLSSVSM